MKRRMLVIVGHILLTTSLMAAAPQTTRITPAATAESKPAPFIPPPNLARSDAAGNPIRFSTRTAHISNYDETKVAPYTLPNPLLLSSGTAVTDAATWANQRRPEILKLYREQIYGRIPAAAPKVNFEVTSTAPAMNDTVIVKHITGHIGSAGGPTMNLLLVVPAKITHPVPIIFSIQFGAPTDPSAVPATGRGRGAGGAGDSAPLNDVLAHGYAYAALQYTNIQPDSAAGLKQGVIGMSLSQGQNAPAADEWGSISAWAWGISRVMDYFETDASVDAKRIAIVGHSRLGKTVLWAGAQDERIALVFSSCAGELGSALARRDWGETVDDMAQNFPWQFAGNLQQYAGHWNDMPVDAHFLIALCAPRPVFITGGTTDQWTDPKGEYLAEIAAGPVYKLLGKKDLGVTDADPPLDKALATGELGFHYHTGGHTILPSDWVAFFPFVDAHLHPEKN